MQDLQDRTKQFALDVFRLCRALPEDPAFRVVRRQLLKASSSLGAAYRAAGRAPSKKAFIAKLALVEEEADESAFWLELLEALGFEKSAVVPRLRDEAHQLTAIMVASRKTARNGRAKEKQTA
jgi:four helix bundle protein